MRYDIFYEARTERNGYTRATIFPPMTEEHRKLLNKMRGKSTRKAAGSFRTLRLASTLSVDVLNCTTHDDGHVLDNARRVAKALGSLPGVEESLLHLNESPNAILEENRPKLVGVDIPFDLIND